MPLRVAEIPVHIVLPFRGREDYFMETVRSVIDQTHQNWRLSVYDNSNILDLSDWISSLNDSRVKYFRSNTQVSLVQNFTRAVSGIETDWGMILGADDILHREFLVNALRTAKEFHSVSAILPRVVPINNRGKVSWTLIDRTNHILTPLSLSGIFLNEKALSRLCFTNWMYITSMLVKKEIFLEIPFCEKLENTFDLDFMIKMFTNGDLVAYSPKATFYYRRHNETASLNNLLAISRAKEEQYIFSTLSRDLFRDKKFFLCFVAKLRLGYRLYVVIRAVKSSNHSRSELLRIALGR
jgi:glycosyltransferase involved in cell wall biosynthesis